MRYLPSTFTRQAGCSILVVLALGGCSEPLRVALGARAFVSWAERCTVPEAARGIARIRGRAVDAIGVGRARIRCTTSKGERGVLVEVVEPAKLSIEGPTTLRYTARDIYRLRAVDRQGRPLEVGLVQWQTGDTLSESTACGDFPIFGCPSWRHSTRIRATRGLRGELVARLGRRSARLAITIQPEETRENRYVALGARLGAGRFGRCKLAAKSPVISPDGSRFVATAAGKAELSCSAAGGARRSRVTISVQTAERIEIRLASPGRVVANSVAAAFDLRALVKDASSGAGYQALEVGELSWKWSEHFARAPRCFTPGGLCAKPIKAGAAWVRVAFGDKTYRKEVVVHAKY